MRKLTTNAVAMLLALVGCMGCGNRSASSVDNLIRVDVMADYPEKELILQDLMDVEYIALETTDDFITKGAVKAIGKDIMLVTNRGSDGDILVFDRNGKGLRKINRLGQSGEEYTQLTGLVLDEDNDEIFVKEPKTRSGDRYVYFSAEMESLLREYQKECRYITETYDQRELTDDDFLFRRQGAQLPMTPTTFTYRFKLILKKNGLPQGLNVHSLRHTAASLMIAGGADVATVAGILGHSQPSTTLDIYTHAFDKNKKAASAGLQEMLEI